MLYLILPLMIGLFSIEFRAPITPRGHQFVQIVIILLIFSVVWIWLEANKQALIQERLEESRSSHQAKLYIVLSPEFLPLEEQIDQCIHQDGLCRQPSVQFDDWLADTNSSPSNQP